MKESNTSKTQSIGETAKRDSVNKVTDDDENDLNKERDLEIINK